MNVVISMWSGPRNISTTMMRAFAARSDTTALDEPFYGVFLRETGADHPYAAETLERRPTTLADAAAWIGEPRSTEITFLKNIAYHVGDAWDLSFANAYRNFILIRDPRAMIASFAAKLEDARPIARSYAVARALKARLAALERPCPVVDSADILDNPPRMLTALCAALGIPFDRSMLSWPAGARPEDGPWAAHWYDSVRKSTGFNRPVDKRLSLSSAQEAIAATAMEDYLALRADRLR